MGVDLRFYLLSMSPNEPTGLDARGPISLRFEKAFLSVLTTVLWKRKWREAARHRYEARRNLQNADMKFGITYSVWDGEELLEKSLDSVRGTVHYINVVWQQESWHGRPCSPELLSILQGLLEKGKIDEIIEYRRDPSLSPGKNEKAKRNLGLEHARRHGVDYLMPMDADEFYIDEELRRAQTIIMNDGVTHAFCPQVSHGPDKTEVNLLAPSCYVTLFFKLTRWKRFGRNTHVPCLVDPTRRPDHNWLLSRYRCIEGINMHHLSTVRRGGTASKFQNSSNPELNALRQDEFEARHQRNRDMGYVAATQNPFDINL